MKDETVHRDERTVSVENASYRLAYLVVSFGLLLSTIYRGYVRHEQAWDLLGLVVLGGVVASTYQGLRGVLTGRWLAVILGVGALALVVAALLVLGLGV